MRNSPAGEDLRSCALAKDLLRGAGEIAAHLFGADTPANRHRVYYLSKRSRYPIAKCSGTLLARKSSLQAFIEAEERKTK